MSASANARDISTVLYGAATIQQQLKEQQLQGLLIAFVSILQHATPLEISDTLWSVATLSQEVPEDQLQLLLADFAAKLQQATPRHVVSTLWACAKLGYLPQQLLAAPELAGLLQAGSAQQLANAARACGQLGHRDEQLMAALLPEVQRRLTAASSSRNTPVHTWLLDFQLAGAQGLQGSLTAQQLQQCRAWDRSLQEAAGQGGTDFQRSVFAAVCQLPITWQQQPQMEQLSVGRGGFTTDGALLLDIAGRTANGVLVAVEADGPTHFRRPDGGLKGATQYRNRALADASIQL
ncbi:hypothetical protein COO60DRAFT_1705894 [Scenedesmus sp. NREL 46B-D3]|nr:hypothetical protein COO60DRAFT_1705894 [Scenedesmus sp. NREL 46B-D3]